MSLGNDGGSRVSIPADLRKTIQSIWEITGKKHSDEDIFTVFKDCFDDPNETAQKLLFLDIFHEVKSKRDRKKENSTPTTQGRGKNGRRSYSSSYSSSDAGCGRNAASRRENGANNITEGSKSSSFSPQKARSTAVPRAIKMSNGSLNLSNGGSNHKSEGGPTNAVNKLVIAEEALSKSSSNSGVRVEPEKSKTSSDLQAPLVSDYVVVQNLVQEVKQTPSDNNGGISEPILKTQSSDLLSSSVNNQDGLSDVFSNANRRSFQVIKEKAVSNGDIDKSQLLPESDVADGPHVTFPLHFQVTKKAGFTFGSFGSTFEMETNCIRSNNEDLSLNVESSHGMEEDAGESSPGTDEISANPLLGLRISQGVSTVVQEIDHNNSHSAPEIEQVSHSENIVPSSEQGSKGDRLKQEAKLSPETRVPIFQSFPGNNSGLMPSQSATIHPIQSEATKTQIRNSEATDRLSSATTDQTPVAASQQPIHLFRQHYPPNYFPYGPYLSPFYMPHIHQFLAPNGLPQQPHLPQFKPRTNTGNPAPVGIPSAYGSSPITFNHVQPATSLSSSRNEDVMTSQSKENIYTTGLQSENLAAWMQNLASLQVNSMYNLPLQGQQLPFLPLQSGHGGFAGIYQPIHTVATPLTTTVEAVGPTPAAYQQPQLAQSNWNANF